MRSVTLRAGHRPEGRIVELDGIRGLAILLVVVFHYVFRRAQVTPHTWQAYALIPLRLGWSGVDLFFVLSGFLIGGILYDAKYSQSYYRTFYLRRAHRIFPLYFLWIALFVAGQQLTGTNSVLQQIFNRDVPLWSFLFFTQNLFMAFTTALWGHWAGITWSLAVEEQFYFLLPWFIRKLSTGAIVITTVASVLAAPLLRYLLWRSGNDFNGPYTLLPCRADALGLGVLIAIAVRNQRVWEWLGAHRRHIYGAFFVLACGFVYLTLRPAYIYLIGLTWIAALCASVLLLVVVNPGRVERVIFRSPILTSLGTVAFAVYLSHDGIDWLLHFAFFGSEPKFMDWPTIGVTSLSLAIVLILSAVSWRFLEKPLIRRAHKAYKYAEPVFARDASAQISHAPAFLEPPRT